MGCIVHGVAQSRTCPSNVHSTPLQLGVSMSSDRAVPQTWAPSLAARSSQPEHPPFRYPVLIHHQASRASVIGTAVQCSDLK